MKAPGILNDVLFKIVFGAENSEPVLKALVNALLGLRGAERIQQMTILNPFLNKDYADDRGVVLDVKA